MPVTAIYPGTFDPITLGHQDIIQRARHLFDMVLVAVADTRHKKTLFNMAERKTLVSEVTAGQDGVEVCRFDSLVVDLAHARKAQVIVRGLRAVADFDYEFQMAVMNQRLSPDVETVFLTPAEQYCTLSSSLIKEVAALSGDVSPFVHKRVAEALRRKYGVA